MIYAYTFVEHTPKTHQTNIHMGCCLQKLTKTRKYKTPSDYLITIINEVRIVGECVVSFHGNPPLLGGIQTTFNKPCLKEAQVSKFKP
jgi:hypothetical protein